MFNKVVRHKTKLLFVSLAAITTLSGCAKHTGPQLIINDVSEPISYKTYPKINNVDTDLQFIDARTNKNLASFSGLGITNLNYLDDSSYAKNTYKKLVKQLDYQGMHIISKDYADNIQLTQREQPTDSLRFTLVKAVAKIDADALMSQSITISVTIHSHVKGILNEYEQEFVRHDHATFIDSEATPEKISELVIATTNELIAEICSNKEFIGFINGELANAN